MQNPAVQIEHRDGVVWLTVNNAAQHSASGLLSELAEQLTGLALEDGPRVVVLTGADLFGLQWDDDTTRDDAGSVRWLSEQVRAIAESELPVIAAIQSDAVDAGLELALACDVRLAAIDVRFGFPRAAEGLMPLAGGVARLARIAGRATALQLLLTGETLGPGEALSRGLISGIYAREQLLPEAGRLADVIAQRGPIAVRYAKEAVVHGIEMPLDQALRFETDLTIILQTTADRAEGVRAFTEKRPPTFTGR